MCYYVTIDCYGNEFTSILRNYYRSQTKFAKVMFLHLSVILSTGGLHSRGHAWWGVCVAGSMHGRGWVCMVGACVAGGCAWVGGMCGWGCVAGGHAWQGACMAGGHVWQGASTVGGVWQGGCMVGGMCATADTMGYGQ